MLRKILAIVLVWSCIALSGFDLIEDLPSQNDIFATTASSHEHKSPSIADESGTLTIDFNDSALRMQRASVVLSNSGTVTFALEPTFEFRTGFRLHNLYQVFLI
jgi:hypothetical protein